MIDASIIGFVGIARIVINPTEIRAALHNWAENRGSATVRELGASSSGVGENKPPTSSVSGRDSTIALWFAREWRWRVETVSGGHSETYVSSGDVWRLWDGRTAFGGASINSVLPHILPLALGLAISPASFLASLQLTPAGPRSMLGRKAEVYDAMPLDPDDQPWAGATTYRLMLDTEYRLLLGLEVLAGDTSLCSCQFLELSTNVDIPDETFHLELPLGANVLEIPALSPKPSRRPASWPRLSRPRRDRDLT